MLYSNVKLKAIRREMPFGPLYYVSVGEDGRGRREIRLSCPEGTVVENGLNMNLTIGLTKTGNPRINAASDHNMFFLLSSKGGYTRKGNGWIGAWKQNQAQYQLIVKGNGADGDAGRIGQWDVVLLNMVGTANHDWLRIRTSGGGYGTDPQLLYINNGDVIAFSSEADAQIFCDQMNINAPDFKSDDPYVEFPDVTHY